MPDTPPDFCTTDFYTLATRHLHDVAGGANDEPTVVLASIKDGAMLMQTRAPRGPRELVHIARRLLEDAVDMLVSIESEAGEPEASDAETARIAVEGALAELPDPDDPPTEEGEA